MTDDVDVYDTVTITKIYDGEKGDPGAAGGDGKGGLSDQNIMCLFSGNSLCHNSAS